jgi:hypothetical protein
MMKSTPVEDKIVDIVGIVGHCNNVIERIKVLLCARTKMFEKARRVTEKAVTRQDTKNEPGQDDKVLARRLARALIKARRTTEKAVTRQDTKNKLEQDGKVLARKIARALIKVRRATEKSVTRQDTKNKLKVISENNIRIVFAEEN